MGKKIAFILAAEIILVSWGFLASAAPGDVRCFGLEGNKTVISKTVELSPQVANQRNVVEYSGEGDSYLFHATVLSDGSAVFAVSQNQMPVGSGVTSPVVKLQPLLKEPLILGLLSPTQVLTVFIPTDEKTPSAYVGCGIE